MGQICPLFMGLNVNLLQVTLVRQVETFPIIWNAPIWIGFQQDPVGTLAGVGRLL